MGASGNQEAGGRIWIAVGGIAAFVLGWVALYPLYVTWVYFLGRARGCEQRPAVAGPQKWFWLRTALPLALLIIVPLVGWWALATLPGRVYSHGLAVGAHRVSTGPSSGFLFGLGMGAGVPALLAGAAILGLAIAAVARGDAGEEAEWWTYWGAEAYERIHLAPYEEAYVFQSHDRMPDPLWAYPCVDSAVRFNWVATIPDTSRQARVEFLYYRQSSVLLTASGSKGQARSSWCGAHTVRNPNPFPVVVTLTYVPLVRGSGRLLPTPALDLHRSRGE